MSTDDPEIIWYLISICPPSLILSWLLGSDTPHLSWSHCSPLYNLKETPNEWHLLKNLVKPSNWASQVTQLVKNLPAKAGDVDLTPESGRSPGEGNGNPTPVFLPGESHGWRSLAGYSPWGHKESDSECLNTHKPNNYYIVGENCPANSSGKGSHWCEVPGSWVLGVVGGSMSPGCSFFLLICPPFLSCDKMYLNLMYLDRSFYSFYMRFVYFWLRWVSLAVRGRPPVVESRARASRCSGFSLQSTSSRHTGFSSCGTQA